jgi:curli biogenesis system outer membrane secretion channel CsgG
MTKTSKCFALVLCLLLLMVFVHTLNAQGKLRVAVVRFNNNSTWHWWGDRLGEAAADVFVTALMDSGKFSLIERQKVDSVLAEQDFGASGRITPQTAAKIGKMLGVDLLLTGSVSEFSISRTGGAIKSLGVGVTTGKVVLQARLVNTTTGEIMVSAEEENKKNLVNARYKSIDFHQKYDYGLANDVMHPAVKKMVSKIVKKTEGMATSAHSGRVIKAEGNKVWINAGTNAGIKVGDEFEVIRKGEELIDPDTGLALGAEEESVGKIVIVEVKEKYAVATIQRGNAQAEDFLKKL